MAQISKLPLHNSLLSKSLNQRNPFEMVADTYQYYNTPFLTIVYAMNGWSSKQINVEKYEKAKLGNLAIATEIFDNKPAGANLDVFFTDASFDQLRIGDKVMDSNRFIAYVVATSPGIVTIQPFTSGALVAATHFTKNMTIKLISDASPNRASVGKSSLYVTPDLDYNFYSVKRDSVFIAGEDMTDTYVKYKNEDWYFQQEMEMLRRLSVNIENDFIWSERGYQIVTPQGLTNSNGGMIWATKNRGGGYEPATSAITIDSLLETIYSIQIKRGKPTQEVTFLLGSGAFMQIQKVLQDYAKYAGTNNTFGGVAVKGFDINTFTIIGITCKFIKATTLDNPKVWTEPTAVAGLVGSKMSNSFIAFDTSPIPVSGGGTMPSIEVFHYGKEMYYGHINGMVAAGGDPKDYMNPADTVISSDVDGITAHAQVKNGIDIIDASGMYFREMVY